MIRETEPDWLCKGGGRPEGVGAHPCLSDRWALPSRGGFLSLLDYTFSVYGPFSLCKPDMWTIFGRFQLVSCRNRHSPKLMEFY
jgi:hypothetical protein